MMHTNCSETCPGNYKKTCACDRVNYAKVKTIVVQGFAKWMQDHGNQQEHFNKYLKIIANLMTNPCKIDARKSRTKNMENNANMEPKLKSDSIINT